ncbi:hypothetical protein H072_11488 [Dactylellina haptotyla CBS 200.50]|uniref:DBF4-type domain-containing protein n=1 Tax=Dactylellina haptotyla (strain CBS 200.50) TaxID=1284197 RepID=S8A1X0_DACHA|nr:hypothetical protein H072_11488 [Dactylellina haptotyla CBS 200.50]
MSRRVPLSNIQNHAQSYQLNAAIPAKRPAKSSRDALGPPPAKKAHLDDAFHGPDQKENRHGTPSKLRLVPKTPSRHDGVNSRRDVPPSRIARSKAGAVAAAAAPARRLNEKFDSRIKDRKAAAASSQRTTSTIVIKDKHLQQAVAENNEAIRQWQRHYRRVFPTLTFYFDDSMSEDKRALLRIQLRDLDSTVVDKFSTGKVTHIITARDDIPPELPKDHITAGNGTINPKLLGVGVKLDHRDSALAKLNVYDDHKDILVLARLAKMKIWTTEKIERMISTLHERIDDDIMPSPEKLLPSKLKQLDRTAYRKATDEMRLQDEGLERLLREDKYRFSQSSSKEMYTFKGPYIMVGDASGRYKPFIIREFQTFRQPEDGDWPQFRSNREGRCPFVLDPDTKRSYMREEAEKEAADAKAKLKEKEAARLKAKTSMEPPPRQQSLKAKTSFLKEEPTRSLLERKPLSSIENKVDRDMATAAAATAIKKTEVRLDKLREVQRARQNHLVVAGYEPVASGLNATGPTSAVVSQAISSNTAVAGPKAGTSRDVQRLNRRVFEKTTGGIRQTDTTAALKAVDEEVTVEVKVERKSLKRSRSQTVAKEVKKVPQAGYCENCRDKYDDFEDHIVSKRHMRFASNDDNFTELDALLSTLTRPCK